VFFVDNSRKVFRTKELYARRFNRPRDTPSAAKAADENSLVIAALKRSTPVRENHAVWGPGAVPPEIRPQRQ